MYNYVTEFNQLGNFVSAIQKADEVFFDVEATGLDFFVDKIILMQAKVGDTTFVFDTRKLGDKYSKYIVSVIKDSDKLVVGFNLKFDMRMVYSNYGELFTNVFDTMLAQILITNGLVTGKDRYFSLATLVEKYCNVTLDKSIREDFFKQEDLVITEQHLIYASQDVEYLKAIKDKQLEKLKEQKQVKTCALEMMLLPVVADMEHTGVLLDKEAWSSLGGESGIKVKQLGEELVNEFLVKIIERTKDFNNALEVVDFLKLGVKKKGERKALEEITDAEYIKTFIKEHLNLNSPDQMLIILKDVYGIPIESTNEKIINKYITKYEIIKKIIDYRENQKKLSSFGDNFISAIHPATGRIHTEFNQLGAQSGRFSSSGTNLCNIPRESVYRSAFIAREGHKLIAVDFSQEELRLLAVLANVKGMIEAFNKSIDLHLATASNLYKIPLDQVTKDQRSKGKTLNFAVGYGSTEYGLYKNFGIPMEEGKVLLKAFFEDAYPEIKASMKLAESMIFKYGFSATMGGRKRFFEMKTFFPGGKYEEEKYRASVLREGFNHMIQGSGGDIIKESLCRIYYENPFGEDLKILIQVYDEIVCEVSDEVAEQAKAFIEKIMIETEEKYLKGVVPAVVDGKMGKVWEH
jgi:DNA polymerase I-like protein with 3'-5' exonuclease and polymerase domains